MFTTKWRKSASQFQREERVEKGRRPGAVSQKKMLSKVVVERLEGGRRETAVVVSERI